MNVLIDMGGTNTRVGFSEDLKSFKHIVKYETPKTKEENHRKLKETFDEFESPKNIDKIILAIAGTVHQNTQRVLTAPHIHWINDMEGKEIIGMNNPNIHVRNDSELAGYAEALNDYLPGASRVAYITISTGVGGTLIVDKKLPQLLHSFEPGHMIIDRSSAVEPVDGIYGSFESLCSGTAFTRRYNMKPQECEDPMIWRNYGIDLGVGLYNVALLWQIDLIVVGGSVSNKWTSFEETLLETFNSFKYSNKAKIVKSQLGDRNVLIGGLKFLKSISN